MSEIGKGFIVTVLIILYLVMIAFVAPIIYDYLLAKRMSNKIQRDYGINPNHDHWRGDES